MPLTVLSSLVSQGAGDAVTETRDSGRCLDAGFPSMRYHEGSDPLLIPLVG